ncbi:MAG: TetR/AcrR family transcriptional regulator [Burkholderia sp.]|jgi:AcrR family transcriptional regulator|uniref:TetR/AcrR family transcriptional regulator n=1 Tax=Burkholderia sp. TaxID=36773 RepID=UPI002820A38D|nr:TetR/AcrR family transcriptional regulator [Burkholderia sp.]MDR0241431.1 TetR/AcrR family transcriptional regulator [Burkholderia sp.]
MARTRNENLHQQRREPVLTAADMSAGAVFRYFADKREMIDAIIVAEVERYMHDVERSLNREGLLRLARITADELAGMTGQTDAGLGVDSWLELARDADRRPDFVALDRKLRAEFACALASGQAEGWVRPSLDPAGAASIVFSLQRHVARPEPRDRLRPGAHGHRAGRLLPDLRPGFLTSRAALQEERPAPSESVADAGRHPLHPQSSPRIRPHKQRGRIATKRSFPTTSGRKSTGAAFGFESRCAICVRMPPLSAKATAERGLAACMATWVPIRSRTRMICQPLETYAL